MKTTKTIRTASILFLLIACAWLLPQAPSPALAQAGAGLDVVLVIDNSGSMLTSDPNGLRWSAAHLFVDLSSSGDQVAGIWFDDMAQPWGSGVLTPIQNEASRQALKQSMQSIQPDPNGSTNMEAAVRLSLERLGTGGANRPVIVFLTDGFPTPESQRPALNELILQAGREGIAIFPILLGGNTDQNLGRNMANNTGGLMQQVQDASGLLRSFGNIYSYLRPESYLDELSLTGGGGAFRTNPAQALVEYVVVAPRQSQMSSAIQSLTLDGTPLPGSTQLANGAQVSQAESVHYQLLRVTHNTPIAGEWYLTSSGNETTALLLAQSAVTLDVQLPVSSVAGSFVAPRRVPAGKPVLLVASVLQDGRPLGNMPLSVTISDGPSLSLSSTSLSQNHEVAWQILDLGSFRAGEQQAIEIQIGSEFSPFRMRKEFVLEAVDAPYLVVDSPTLTNPGLITGGNLRIAAHFDGDGVTNLQVRAYVYNAQSEAVESFQLECDNGTCQNEQFQPQPGHLYQITLVSTASFGGLPYSDGARTELSTGDLVRVDGLECLAQPVSIIPGAGLSSIPLTVTAYTQSGQPDVSISLDSLHPVPPGITADDVVASLTSLTPQGSNTYSGAVQFAGFDRLPPGEYSAQLNIQAGEVTVIPSSVSFKINITTPVAHFLNLRNPLDLGELTGLQEPVQITAAVDYGNQTPFDLAGVVSELRSTLGPENTQLLQVDVGHLDQGQVVLRFSALQALHPGSYSGVVQFQPADASNPAIIEPAQVRFAFSIPQPTLTMLQVSAPQRLSVCSHSAQVDRPDDYRLLFGAFTSTEHRSELTLVFDSKWVTSPPDIDVEIIQLHRQGSPDYAITPVRFTTGTIHTASEGGYALPLMLELPDGLRHGEYLGEIKLSSDQAAIEQDRLTVSFAVRTNFLGRVQQTVLPGYCKVMGWYVWPPSLWAGLRNWALTLVGLLILSNTAIRLFGAQGQGTLYMKGASVEFTDRRPAYIVRRGNLLELSCQPADAAAALVEVRIERDSRDDISYARLRTGSSLAGTGLAIGVWSERQKGFVRLPNDGARLANKGRFLLASRRGGRQFSVSIEN